MAENYDQIIRTKFKEFRHAGGKNGREWRVNCPFCVGAGHSPDRKFKLHINPHHLGGVYNCFRCGASGGLGKLLGKRVSTSAAPAPATQPRRESKVRLPGAMTPVNQLPADHIAVQYLTTGRARSFDLDFLATFYHVGFCEEGRTFGDGVNFAYATTGTLVFPIYAGGELIGWQSRMLVDPADLTEAYYSAFEFPTGDDGEWVRPPKYYTSPGFPKGKVFYNWDNAFRQPYVVVGEGVFDSLAVGAAGLAGLGKGLTDVQVNTLATYCDHVIVALDPDAAEESQKLVRKLRRSVSVSVLSTEGYGDLGDMPGDVIQQRINQVYPGGSR